MMLSSHPRRGQPSDLLPSPFEPKSRENLSSSPMNFTFLGLMFLMMAFSEHYKGRSSHNALWALHPSRVLIQIAFKRVVLRISRSVAVP